MSAEGEHEVSMIRQAQHATGADLQPVLVEQVLAKLPHELVGLAADQPA